METTNSISDANSTALVNPQQAFPFEEEAHNAKVQHALDVFRTFGPGQISYSGGKDSDVLLALARRAGLHDRPVYQVTTIDPPEVVRHCRDAGAHFDHPGTSYPKEILTRGLPTRWRRWCCEIFKHGRQSARITYIGVRAAESAPRRKRWSEVQLDGKRGYVICPILTWSDQDVWTFIHNNSIRVCDLYSEGFKRLGCIGCPLARGSRLRDFARWPKFGDIIKSAFFASPSCPGSNKDTFWDDWVNDRHGETEEPDCTRMLDLWSSH